MSSTLVRALELGAIPSLTAALSVYFVDKQLLPTDAGMILSLAVDALAIYVGIILGNIINSLIFR